MQSLMEELQQAMFKLSQNAYGDGAAQGQPGADGAKKDDGVVEGEYTVE
jgi:molecular chaperone DnaK